MFLLVNRGAYEGWFSGDDLDNLGWTRHIGILPFLSGLATPVFDPLHNFRPVGHFYFWLMGRLAGLHFPWYVATVHLLHVLNAWLVRRWLRQLGIETPQAGLGALVFLFGAPAIEAFWRPMYIFDVLCALCCLLCLQLHLAGRWIASLACFWLALKAKEVAIGLPLLLLWQQVRFAQRPWRSVVPHVLVAVSLALQALLRPGFTSGEYAAQWSAAGVWTCLRFYASKILLAPLAGLLLPLLALWRNAHLRLGLAAMVVLLGPMLVLPGRLSGAYLYLPLAGLALTVAALAARRATWLLSLGLALWLAAGYVRGVRPFRRYALTVGPENRAYVAELARFLHAHPQVRKCLYDGLPRDLHYWGLTGALRWLSGPEEWSCLAAESVDLAGYAADDPVALIGWDPASARARIVARTTTGVTESFVTMDAGTPLWLLIEGWYTRDNRFRWTKPRARARLRQPQSARTFQVTLNAHPQYRKLAGRPRLEVLLNGESLGPQEVLQDGWHTLEWVLPRCVEREVEVEFRATPEIRPENDPRPLGAPVGAFGFR